MGKWQERFYGIAKEVSSWSSDPSTKIGAVTVSDQNNIISTGWNGFPRGIRENEDRLTNREQKYRYMVHGEQNCIYNATRNGVSLYNSSIYVYGLPICSECAKGIIQVGIKSVYMCYPTDISDKWKDSFEQTKLMFDETGITWQVTND